MKTELHERPVRLRQWFAGVAFLCLISLACPVFAETETPAQPNLFQAIGNLFKQRGQDKPKPTDEPASSAAAATETRTLPTPLAYEKRIALVIGNASYKSGPLLNPVNDARAMADRLRTLGFDVILHENLKVREIGSIYREFRSKITPGGVALMFYAGHGVQFKGENYFPAVDADLLGEEDAPLQSINLNTLLANMEEAKAGVSIVFLDACRDNPFARRFRSGTRGLAKVEAASGTLIHYATRPGSVAWDGEGKNGTYTEALLAQMSEPGVPVEMMLKRVANRVVEMTDGKQEPWVEGHLRGEFYFIFKALATVNVQQAPTDPDTEAWQAAESVNTEMAYHAYLNTYPSGRFVAAANIKLDGFKRPASPGESEKVTIPPAPVVVPTVPDDSEAAFWSEVKSSRAKEYYEAYLKQYPKGKYASLAKVELKKIDEQEKAQRAKEEAERERQAAIRREQEKTNTDTPNQTEPWKANNQGDKLLIVTQVEADMRTRQALNIVRNKLASSFLITSVSQKIVDIRNIEQRVNEFSGAYVIAVDDRDTSDTHVVNVALWDTHGKRLDGKQFVLRNASTEAVGYALLKMACVAVPGRCERVAVLELIVEQVSNNNANRFDLIVKELSGKRALALSSPKPIISPVELFPDYSIAYISLELGTPTVYWHDLKTGKRIDLLRKEGLTHIQWSSKEGLKIYSGSELVYQRSLQELKQYK
jgi:hypothetical protein